MDFLQQVGTATFSSSGLLTIPTSYPCAVRVFDFAYGVTGAASSSARLWNVETGGTTNGANSAVALTLNNSVSYLHSDVGYRFPNGVYCWVTAMTATVNYITEVR